MNQAEERYTQWVRATHPYVDAFRATILTQFESQLEESKAAEHFIKWTNRYTLVKAWQFRSGYRFEKVSRNQGRWTKKPNVKPLSMYVMKDAYERTGIRRDRKGHEPWTLDTVSGKREAERMFTVLGMVHRELEPLFSPVIFPKASDNGMTTFAQAIYYNGNDQQPVPIGTRNSQQAKLGWDTLNWDPSAATPEWGSEPSRSSAKWPWEIFEGAREVGTARVKLNWQAKLMPVTKARLRAAAADQLLGEMRNNLGIAALAFDKMVTH
jgi:hypothetical protein